MLSTRGWRSFGAAVLATLVLSCGCTHVTPSPTRPVALHVVTVGPVTSVEPTTVEGPLQTLIVRNVFATLLTVGPEGGEPVPDLAESCHFDSHTRYTCRIKDAAAYPDGSAVTPADVVWSLSSRPVPERGTSARWQQLAEIVRTVVAVDEHNVTFELQHFDARLPYLLADVSASIMRAGTNPPTGPSVAGLSGPGAYSVATGSLATGTFELKANPHALSAASRGNDQVAVESADSVVAGVDRVRQGAADVVVVPPGARGGSPVEEAGNDLTVVQEPASATTAMVVSTSKATLAVRHAVAALIDRDALARAAGGSLAPLTSLVPPTVPSALTSDELAPSQPPDPVAAAGYLRDAGVSGVITLHIGREVDDDVATELARQLAAGKVFDVARVRSRGDLALHVTDPGDAPSPFAYLSEAARVGGSSTVAEQVEEAATDPDAVTRERSLVQAQQLAASVFPTLPLWQEEIVAVTAPGVERLSVTPFVRLSLVRPAA